MTFNQNFISFIQENAIENVVCQNGGHFVQGGWVKGSVVMFKIPTTATDYADASICTDKVIKNSLEGKHKLQSNLFYAVNGRTMVP